MTACQMARRVSRSRGLQLVSVIGGLATRASAASSRREEQANAARRGCGRTARRTRAGHRSLELAARETLAGWAGALMAGPEAGWRRLSGRGQLCWSRLSRGERKRVACRRTPRLQGPQLAAASSQNDERTWQPEPCAQLPRGGSAYKMLEGYGGMLAQQCNESSSKGITKEQINIARQIRV